MKYFYLILIHLILIACDNSTRSGSISFNPSSLPQCDPASEVLVSWDIRKSHPNVDRVNVYVKVGEVEKLFADSGSSGEAKTGPWARPGSPIFLLKDPNSNLILDQAVIDGPICN